MKVNPPNTQPIKKQTQKTKQKEKQHTKKGGNKSLWQKVLQSFFICLGLFLSGSSRKSDCNIFKIM